MSDHELKAVTDYLSDCFANNVPLSYLDRTFGRFTLQEALIQLYHNYRFSIDLEHIKYVFTSKELQSFNISFYVTYIFIDNIYTESEIRNILRILFKHNYIHQYVWEYLNDSINEYFEGEKLDEVIGIMNEEYVRKKLVMG